MTQSTALLSVRAVDTLLTLFLHRYIYAPADSEHSLIRNRANYILHVWEIHSHCHYYYIYIYIYIYIHIYIYIYVLCVCI